MFIFRHAADFQHFLKTKKEIGFVPTMGVLHQGHISLIETARKTCETVVCSIFVNPTQFNNQEDFDKYPNTIPADILKLEAACCDVLFLPSVEEIYPKGYQAEVYDLNGLDFLLEGAERPGHYQGVAQVVHRLLQLVQPSKMFMGLKDFQQIMVVKQMIASKGINVQIISCETEREPSGLAMSSRNMRLNEMDKAKAVAIADTMKWMIANHQHMAWPLLEKEGKEKLQQVSEKVEYVVIRDASNLEELSAKSKQAVVLVAAWFGGVRLIDNMIFNL